jgi:hypothetical protein
MVLFFFLGFLYLWEPCYCLDPFGARDWNNHLFGSTGIFPMGATTEKNTTYSRYIWDKLVLEPALSSFTDSLRIDTVEAHISPMFYKYLDKRKYNKWEPDAAWVVYSQRWGREIDLHLFYQNAPYYHIFSFFEDPFSHWFVTRHTHTLPMVQESQTEFLDYSIINSGLNYNPKPIKILSSNIWNLNYDQASTYEEKMRSIIKQVQASDADIIGFQEVRFSNVDYPRYISRILCNAP